ncbi:MAG: hypothetical protein JJ863_38540 [Deltaproteobacteria bacterium]|nr:hypothetical protein [Deltaproteobacteria bacterium]
MLSNASHDRYKKVGKAAKKTLREAFGDYDVSVASADVERRARAAEEQGAFGLALRAIGEELIAERLTKDAQRRVGRIRAKLLDRLAALPAASRRVQLRSLEDWLHSIAEERRDSALAKSIIEWLRGDVIKPLHSRLPERDPALAAHRLVVHRYELTRANHAGEPKAARDACQAIDQAIGELGGRWEHSEPILEALIHQAVHLTDCFEHEEAARRAKSVADYYGELGSLFSTLLPTVFPERIGSDQRARALGTALQAEMYRGLLEPEHLSKARELSDAALSEFEAPSDIAQQHQYRAQLETYAGDFDAALAHLATSLRIEPSHTAVGEKLEHLGGFAQGFAALHWARLVAHILEDGSDDPGLLAAVDRAKLHTLDWVTGEAVPYPAHGVRRHLARIQGARGDLDGASSTLGHLRRLREKEERPLFTLIDGAAHARVVSSLLRDHRNAARDLTRKAPVGTLMRLASSYQSEMPKLSEAARSMGEALEKAEDESWDRAATRLFRAAAHVGF